MNCIFLFLARNVKEKGFEAAWARGGDWREGAKKFRKNFFSLFSVIRRDCSAGHINAADAAAVKTVYVCFLPLFCTARAGKTECGHAWKKRGDRRIYGAHSFFYYVTQADNFFPPPKKKRQ